MNLAQKLELVDKYIAEIKANGNSHYCLDLNKNYLIAVGSDEDVEDALINLYCEFNNISDSTAYYLDETRLINDLVLYDYEIENLDNLKFTAEELEEPALDELLEMLKDEAGLN